MRENAYSEQDLHFVLAGGKGTRLYELTAGPEALAEGLRAKPAVRFGTRFRIIDFILSNLRNSFRQKDSTTAGLVDVLTQFKSGSLHNHLRANWYERLPGAIRTDPAHQDFDGAGWYLGTADAIARNGRMITTLVPRNTMVWGGDHIYSFNVNMFEEFHEHAMCGSKGADMTIAMTKVPYEIARGELGTLRVGKDGEVLEFQEKVSDPARCPDDPSMVYASMGNYIFRSPELLKLLARDQAKEYLPEGTDDLGKKERKRKIFEQPDRYTTRDFGFDIINDAMRQGKAVFGYDFRTYNRIPGATPSQEQTIEDLNTWYDVGTIAAFAEANMELCERLPKINTKNKQWPIYGINLNDSDTKYPGNPHTPDSVIGPGCIISGVRETKVLKSVVGLGTHVSDGVLVDNCILLGFTHIEEDVQLNRVLADTDIRIPSGYRLGFDDTVQLEKELRLKRRDGYLIIPKHYTFPGQQMYHAEWERPFAANR